MKHFTVLTTHILRRPIRGWFLIVMYFSHLCLLWWLNWSKGTRKLWSVPIFVLRKGLKTHLLIRLMVIDSCDGSNEQNSIKKTVMRKGNRTMITLLLKVIVLVITQVIACGPNFSCNTWLNLRRRLLEQNICATDLLWTCANLASEFICFCWCLLAVRFYCFTVATRDKI